MRFSVWAPRAREGVEVELGGQRWALERGPGDFWFRDVPDVAAGTQYAFVVDGGRPLPDPRSLSQPRGVHGPSEVIDLGAFPWTDQGWRGFHLPGSVLYELHVGTFSPSGTFDGVIERLDHLVELGVDAIELMPVVEFPGARGWGYDGVDLFAPHHAYGGPAGLMRLIDACHARGLGVVIDVVYNHLGPSGNYLAQFGPYFSERHHTNWGPAVNLDGAHSDQVRRFFLDNATLWLRDYHADGLRLDAVHALVDDSAIHFLEELSEEVKDLSAAVGRRLWLLPESDLSDPRFVLPTAAGGYGLDAAWADEWHHALHATLTGERDGYYLDFETLAHLAKALRQAWVYDGSYSPHRRRRHGRPPLGLEGHQFVVCTQNHDQVGNRAQGERLSHLVSPECAKIAAALLLTSPFVPLLFQGEEWGASTPFLYFTDHEDQELGRAVSEGRRNEFRAFGWDPAQVPDPQAPETFQRSKLDWAEASRSPHAELLAWYKELLELRRARPELRSGRLEDVHVTFDEAARWLVMFRRHLAVVVNLGQKRTRIPLTTSARSAGTPTGGVRVLLASAGGNSAQVSGDGPSLEIDPACVAIVELA
jgi:maltooligosyltrehalose trehalohydrolase